jgi:hypothetical protein
VAHDRNVEHDPERLVESSEDRLHLLSGILRHR